VEDRIVIDEIPMNDNLVSYWTARNFFEDGFSKSFFIPNRKGNIIHNYWKIPCSNQSQSRTIDTPLVPNPHRQIVSLANLKNDCFYTHMPPFADWFYTGLYFLGAKDLVAMKVATVFLKIFTIYLFFQLLVSSGYPIHISAVSTASIVTSFGFISWSSALYYHSLQAILVILLLLTGQKTKSRKSIMLLSFLLAITSFELVCYYPLWQGGKYLISKDRWRLSHLKFYLLGLIAASLLLIFQRTLYFGSVLSVYNDFFNHAYLRYNENQTNWLNLYNAIYDLYRGQVTVFLLFFLCMPYLIWKKRIHLKKMNSLYFILPSFSLLMLNPSYAHHHFFFWAHQFEIFLLFFSADLFSKEILLKSKWLIAVMCTVIFTLNALILIKDFKLEAVAREQFNKENLVFQEMVSLMWREPIRPLSPGLSEEGNKWWDYSSLKYLNNGWIPVSEGLNLFGRGFDLNSAENFTVDVYFFHPQKISSAIFDFFEKNETNKLSCDVIDLESTPIRHVTIINQNTRIKWVIQFPSMTTKSIRLTCRGNLSGIISKISWF
jgi:hypothetical protein